MHPSKKHPPQDEILHTEGSMDWVGPNMYYWLPGPTLVSYMYRVVPSVEKGPLSWPSCSLGKVENLNILTFEYLSRMDEVS